MHRQIRDWYFANMGRILLLLIIIVVFTLTFVYVPYVNILFSNWAGIILIYFAWYFLFPPKSRTLIAIGIACLVVSFLLTLLDLWVFSEKAGEFFYLTLLLVLINEIKRNHE